MLLPQAAAISPAAAIHRRVISFEPLILPSRSRIRVIDTATGRDRPPTLTRPAFVTITAAATLLFAVYAGSFLYFFVDDEAIPLVYARNLLRGRGFVYTVLEGRVEGYSDFLHVLWSSVLLAIGGGFRQSPLFPLVAGKAVSLCAGAAIIVVTARALRRSGVTPAGLVAGLGFLALAGPLAVWSCSSLETAMFALLVCAFGFSLITQREDSTALPVGRDLRVRTSRWLTGALGIAIVLERIDGLFFVLALLFAAWAAEPRCERDVRRLIWPIALVTVGYHGWRYVYFGSLLSAPLEAKVFYRLAGPGHSIAKGGGESYLRSFLDLYGLAAAGVFVAAAAFALRQRAGRLAVIALVLLGIYVGVVQDWMFGWRFVVALLPFAAVIIGVSVGRAPRVVGWCAAALVLGWSGLAARHFVRNYVDGEQRPIFWTDMHRGTSAWLAPYYDAFLAGRHLMHPGDRVSDNQAGLLPYLLDVENIDDLGICSRVVARLPTTDMYFTGVGRYSPLTNQPVLRTAHAYLMYQGVQFIIGRGDLLWKANGDVVPDALLDGLFTRIWMDAGGANVIYRRTDKPAEAYRRDATLFTENLAHTTMLTRASIDNQALEPAAFGPELPFLRELSSTRVFTRDIAITFGFGKHDSDVYGFYVGRITSRLPCTLTLSLADGSGRETLRRRFAIDAGGVLVNERFDAPVRARSASITVDAAEADRVTIKDLRIEGQSEKLREYLRRTLRFPAS